MKKGIIVLGGHVQSYGIVRIFGENKIPSIVIDRTKINIARHSQYCIAFFECEYENLLSLLLKLVNNKQYKGWLLMPTDDYYVRIISQNKEKLSEHFNVTVDGWEIIQIFFNKRNTYPLVHKLGIPIPKTYYPNSIEEVCKISENIDYPCIIKPAIMLDFYRYFKKKVFVCNDSSELKKYFSKALNIIKSDELLIQEIIPGNNENQYSVGIFYDRNKSYNYLAGKRKRQHPIDFGNATTFAETVDIPILIEYAEKILKASNFWGICEVEFKFDSRDGLYKFLEVNPRTWKWHSISRSAKIPFLLSLYNLAIKGAPIIKKNFQPAAWRDIMTDLPIIFRMFFKGMIPKTNIKDTEHAVFNIQDIKPFIFQLIYIPYLLFKR